MSYSQHFEIKTAVNNIIQKREYVFLILLSGYIFNFEINLKIHIWTNERTSNATNRNGFHRLQEIMKQVSEQMLKYNSSFAASFTQNEIRW